VPTRRRRKSAAELGGPAPVPPMAAGLLAVIVLGWPVQSVRLEPATSMNELSDRCVGAFEHRLHMSMTNLDPRGDAAPRASCRSWVMPDRRQPPRPATRPCSRTTSAGDCSEFHARPRCMSENGRDASVPLRPARPPVRPRVTLGARVARRRGRVEQGDHARDMESSTKLARAARRPSGGQDE